MTWLSKDVLKTILWWAIPIIAIIVLGITIRNHIVYVQSLEDDKKQLLTDKGKLNAQVDQLESTNKENERLANEYRNLQKTNKAIGDAEDLIAATRNDFYERLRNDISQSTPSDKCDFALVQRTLDSLWNREAPAGN